MEEVTDPSLLPRVQIKKLVKQYFKDVSFPPAVDNLDLNLYESQITTLLGHNGAGRFDKLVFVLPMLSFLSQTC
jgi:ABC-type uncharacterized transport system ATPase subunit